MHLHLNTIDISDGTNEEVEENGRKFLLPVAEKMGEAAMPGDHAELLFFAAGGDEEDLCNRMRRWVSSELKPPFVRAIHIIA